MHYLGRQLWLSAALSLLLCLSSPLTWLASAQTSRATPCCCPQSLAMPCCQVAPAPAPVAVALVAPARSPFHDAHSAIAPAILAAAPLHCSQGAPVFPAVAALPPPKATPRRTGSCRAPPSKAENTQRFKKEGKHT